MIDYSLPRTLDRLRQLSWGSHSPQYKVLVTLHLLAGLGKSWRELVYWPCFDFRGCDLNFLDDLAARINHPMALPAVRECLERLQAYLRQALAGEITLDEAIKAEELVQQLEQSNGVRPRWDDNRGAPSLSYSDIKRVADELRRR